MHVPQEAFIHMIWWWNVIHLFENAMHDMQSDDDKRSLKKHLEVSMKNMCFYV